RSRRSRGAGCGLPLEGRYRDSLVYERTLLPRKRVVGIEVLRSVVYNKEKTICPFVYKSPFYSIDTVLFYSKKEYPFAWCIFRRQYRPPAGLIWHVQMKRQKKTLCTQRHTT